jgi:hypothetical protein
MISRQSARAVARRSYTELRDDRCLTHIGREGVGIAHEIMVSLGKATLYEEIVPLAFGGEVWARCGGTQLRPTRMRREAHVVNHRGILDETKGATILRGDARGLERVGNAAGLGHELHDDSPCAARRRTACLRVATDDGPTAREADARHAVSVVARLPHRLMCDDNGVHVQVDVPPQGAAVVF